MPTQEIIAKFEVDMAISYRLTTLSLLGLTTCMALRHLTLKFGRGISRLVQSAHVVFAI